MSACLETIPSLSLDTYDDFHIPGEWELQILTDITVAQELLDWLEVRGCTDLECDMVEAGFEVRWRSK